MSIWEIFRDPEVQRIEQRRGSGGLPLPEADPEALAEQVARLTLVTEALWQLVAERSGLHVPDLARVIVEIDRQGSGIVDPNDEQTVRRCADCDAVIPPNAPRCQFCGGEPLAPGQPRRIPTTEAPPAAEPPPAPPAAAPPPPAPPAAAPPPPAPPAAAPPPTAAPPPPPPPPPAAAPPPTAAPPPPPPPPPPG